MTTSSTLRTGSIAVLALAVLVCAALVAGPGLAQETTDDGNESDGSMMTEEGEMMTESGNESMAGEGTTTKEDDMMTEEEMTTEEDMMTEETMGEDEMTTEEGDMMTDEETMGEDGMTTGQESMDDGTAERTASDGQPGFGLAVAVVALVAALGVAILRRVR